MNRKIDMKLVTKISSKEYEKFAKNFNEISKKSIEEKKEQFLIDYIMNYIVRVLCKEINCIQLKKGINKTKDELDKLTENIIENIRVNTFKMLYKMITDDGLLCINNIGNETIH